jgi:hypothetical protein
VSSCATIKPEEIVDHFVSEGYSTLVLTNHLSRFTYKSKAKGDLSSWTWDEKINYYLNGYYDLCRAAEGRLCVLLGVELRSNVDENDYLIYGVEEDFLRTSYDLIDRKIADISAMTHERGYLLFGAHPFRNNMRVTTPTLLDGIEVFNGNVKHDSRNDIARLWAEKFSLIAISGSDFHHLSDGLPTGGIITDSPITSNAELLDILRSGNYELIRNNDQPQ